MAHPLRAARHARGVSTHAVAEALGVHQSTVSRWETGRCRPAPHHRQALATLLDLPPAWLHDQATRPAKTGTPEGLRLPLQTLYATLEFLDSLLGEVIRLLDHLQHCPHVRQEPWWQQDRATAAHQA